MQGLFIRDAEGHKIRPRSKKQVRELIAADPSFVTVEATSMFGDEFDGNALDLPAGSAISFVGPDPYTKRNFYGQLIHTSDGRWVVK